MMWGEKPPAREMPLPVRGEPGFPGFYIIPSKPNAWRAYRVEGQWYTEAQQLEMRQRGMDPNTVETLTVRSVTTSREFWVPMGDRMPVYIIPCPVLRRSKDGTRVQVLSATCLEEWVNSDGSLHDRRPRR